MDTDEDDSDECDDDGVLESDNESVSDGDSIGSLSGNELQYTVTISFAGVTIIDQQVWYPHRLNWIFYRTFWDFGFWIGHFGFWIGHFGIFGDFC